MANRNLSQSSYVETDLQLAHMLQLVRAIYRATLVALGLEVCALHSGDPVALPLGAWGVRYRCGGGQR